jgi:hypothetical protein
MRKAAEERAQQPTTPSTPDNPFRAPVYAKLPPDEEEGKSSSAFYTKRPAMSFAGRRTSKIGKTFDRCVKAVRKTVRARTGSTKESAAIAICTKSVLQTRGRTLKRYRKGRLTTQKKVRGGRS